MCEYCLRCFASLNMTIDPPPTPSAREGEKGKPRKGEERREKPLAARVGQHQKAACVRWRGIFNTHPPVQAIHLPTRQQSKALRFKKGDKNV